jgi:hypothetical protein
MALAGVQGGLATFKTSEYRNLSEIQSCVHVQRSVHVVSTVMLMMMMIGSKLYGYS